MLIHIFASNTFCSIFNKFNVPLFTYCRKFLYSYRMPECVHRDTSFDPTPRPLIIALCIPDFRILCKPCLHSVRRQSHRALVYINKYRMGTCITNCIAGCDEGQGLCQDFVIAFYASQYHTHMESIGPADTHDGTLCSCVGSHFLFKSVNKLAYAANEC